MQPSGLFLPRPGELNRGQLACTHSLQQLTYNLTYWRHISSYTQAPYRYWLPTSPTKRKPLYVSLPVSQIPGLATLCLNLFKARFFNQPAFGSVLKRARGLLFSHILRWGIPRRPVTGGWFSGRFRAVLSWLAHVSQHIRFIGLLCFCLNLPKSEPVQDTLIYRHYIPTT